MRQMVIDFVFLALSVAAGVFFGILSWFSFLFVLSQVLRG